MAILRGFPPSNTISPTIHIGSKDLVSFWVDERKDIAKHLTEEELKRRPSSISIKTKVVYPDRTNHWL